MMEIRTISTPTRILPKHNKLTLNICNDSFCDKHYYYKLLRTTVYYRNPSKVQWTRESNPPIKSPGLGCLQKLLTVNVGMDLHQGVHLAATEPLYAEIMSACNCQQYCDEHPNSVMLDQVDSTHGSATMHLQIVHLSYQQTFNMQPNIGHEVSLPYLRVILIPGEVH